MKAERNKERKVSHNAEWFIYVSSPSDASVPVPAELLFATRGRQFTNKLLQRRRRCSWLVIDWQWAWTKRAFKNRCLFLTPEDWSSNVQVHLASRCCVYASPNIFLSHVSRSAILRFYMYKLPKEKGKKSAHAGEMYLLMQKGSGGWTNGKGTVNDTTGALGRTVGQVYSQGKVCFPRASFCL